jgi:hypothetical protein
MDQKNFVRNSRGDRLDAPVAARVERAASSVRRLRAGAWHIALRGVMVQSDQLRAVRIDQVSMPLPSALVREQRQSAALGDRVRAGGHRHA